jgi:hypothetical protein
MQIKYINVLEKPQDNISKNNNLISNITPKVKRMI